MAPGRKVRRYVPESEFFRDWQMLSTPGGSALISSLPFAILAAMWSGALHIMQKNEVSVVKTLTNGTLFYHPYGYDVVLLTMVLLLSIRTGICYNRYWQQCSHLSLMSSKFLDVCVQAVHFDSKDPNDDEQVTEEELFRIHRFRRRMVHLCSLMHAVALSHLRFRAENMSYEEQDHIDWLQDFTTDLIPEDRHLVQASSRRVLQTHTTPQRTVTMSRWNQFCVSKTGADCQGLTPDAGRKELNRKASKRVLTKSKSRRKLSRSRRDSNMSNKSNKETETEEGEIEKPWELSEKDMSGNAAEDRQFAHYRQLRRVGFSKGASTLHVIGGMGEVERELLRERPHRLRAISFWLQLEFTKRNKEGGVQMPTPILTRLYQEIASGCEGYNQAYKFVERPFPYPLVQTCFWMLLASLVFLPVAVNAMLVNTIVAVPITFFSVISLFSLEVIARQLELCFGTDANDLDLGEFQSLFNAQLLSLLQDADHGKVWKDLNVLPPNWDIVVPDPFLSNVDTLDGWLVERQRELAATPKSTQKDMWYSHFYHADGAESEEMARQREEKKALEAERLEKAEAERPAHECDGGDDDETALELKLDGGSVYNANIPAHTPAAAPMRSRKARPRVDISLANANGGGVDPSDIHRTSLSDIHAHFASDELQPVANTTLNEPQLANGRPSPSALGRRRSSSGRSGELQLRFAVPEPND